MEYAIKNHYIYVHLFLNICYNDQIRDKRKAPAAKRTGVFQILITNRCATGPPGFPGGQSALAVHPLP